MRKNFTPLLLIPGLVLFFSCSKHASPPPSPSPVDSTAANVYLDPGTLNAVLGNNTFNSFNLTHANDTGSFVYIMAKAIVDNDTCVFSISFPDTLHTNIAYANHKTPDTTIIGNDTLNFAHGTIYFSTGFFDGYKGIVYANDVNDNVNGDTLLITTFDKSRHLLAGTFKAIMTASTAESPYITQPTYYVTGSFNTYYNTAK